MKALKNVKIMATISLRAQLHNAIEAKDIAVFGGPGNATMRGLHYRTNRGMYVNRLLYGMK